MAIKTKEELKESFQTYDRPTEQDFADLIDTLSQSSSSGIISVVIAENFDAMPNTRYLCNTFTNSIMATLPLKPNIGDYIELVDASNSFSVNSVFINPSSRLIDGSFSFKRLKQSGSICGLLYTGNTVGWVPYTYRENSSEPIKTLSDSPTITDVIRKLPAVSLGRDESITDIIAKHIVGVLKSNVGSLVPVLTSNTSSPDIIVSASHYTPRGLPFEAFDGNYFWTDQYYWEAGNGTSGIGGPIWLKVQSTTGPKLLKRYGLFSGGYKEYMPKTWQLLGSNNNGATWTTLHSISNKTTWTSNTWTYFNVNATDAYDTFLLNCTESIHPYALNITGIDLEVGTYDELRPQVDYLISEDTTKTITKLLDGTHDIVYDYIP